MVNSISLFGDNVVLWYAMLVWVLIWKGFALWKAARQEQNYWFVALLIVNTVGILEIMYLFIFSKKNWMKKSDAHADHKDHTDHHKEHKEKESEE